MNHPFHDTRIDALLALLMASGGGGGSGSFPPASWSVPNWFIDPVNGNDANAGTSSGTPVKTVTGGIVAKWGSPQVVLNQSTTFHFLNSETSGQEAINLDITMTGGAIFRMLGNYVSQGTTTLATVTAKNRSAQQPLVVTLAAAPPGLAIGWMLRNVTRGSRATIWSISGANLTMTQPYAAYALGAVQGIPSGPDDTWAADDVIIVETSLAINLQSLNLRLSQTVFFGSGSNFSCLQALNLLDSLGDAAAIVESIGGNVFLVDCQSPACLRTKSDGASSTASHGGLIDPISGSRIVPSGD